MLYAAADGADNSSATDTHPAEDTGMLSSLATIEREIKDKMELKVQRMRELE